MVRYLFNFAVRHPREGGDPDGSFKNWIPACAGMTAEFFTESHKIKQMLY